MRQPSSTPAPATASTTKTRGVRPVRAGYCSRIRGPERLDCVALDEVDRAAAEARARHPGRRDAANGAPRSRPAHRARARHLVVVPQRGVAGRPRAGPPPRGPGLERRESRPRRGRSRSRTWRQRRNVASSTRARDRRQHRRRHVAQRADRRIVPGERRDGRLALRPTGVVLDSRRGSAATRCGSRRGCAWPAAAPPARQASERQSRSTAAPSTPQATRELVHQAAVDPDVGVLGPLADPRELQRRDRRRVDRERPGGRELERRRRREPGRRRQRARRGRRGGRASAMPASASAQAVPATYAAMPPARPDRVEVERRPLAGRVARSSSTRRSSVGTNAIRISRSIAAGRTRPRL